MADDGEDFYRSSSADPPVSGSDDGGGVFDTDEPPEAGTGEPTTTEPPKPPIDSLANRLSTGIPEIDRAMNGGVPPGRLLALVSEPGVQSKLLLKSLLAQRQTLYVATDRPEWEVRQDIDPGVGQGDVVIKAISPQELLESKDAILAEMATESNLVIDAINELELVPREQYRSFLSTVKRVLYETGSLGLLFGVSVDHESARDMTLRRADVVWRLETRIDDTELETRLFVPKFKGGAANLDAVKLHLTDEVQVDTSRDIS